VIGRPAQLDSESGAVLDGRPCSAPPNEPGPILVYPAIRTVSWSERGSAAVDAGDLEAAKGCFLKAVKADTRNAVHRFHLAVVLKGLGEMDAAAAALTEALRLNPAMVDAARRLAAWAARFCVSDRAPLNAIGLRAALGHDTADREIIAELAICHLARREPLKSALATGREQGWLAAARSLCLKRTGQVLHNDLMREVLKASAFRHPDTERLLTALRRVLVLEVASTRFADRELMGFVIALMQQCWANEYVWAVSAEEERAIAERAIVTPRLLGGDFEEARKLLLCALYRPLPEILGTQLRIQDLGKIVPSALRDVLTWRLADQADEAARAASIPRLGEAADDTSRNVAQQYQTNPYPRWTSLNRPRENSLRQALGQFFSAAQLGFMDHPFEVLVAGCGTGQHAIRTALAHGRNGHVLCLDLSMASLAYGARMAERLAAGNLAFMQGDIQRLDTANEFWSRFQVVECTGVLHHMADPFRGWRTLVKCLAPGGLMLVGLYSAISRRNLAALRDEPIYPGAGCDVTALRSFRQTLLERADHLPGGELKLSRDFYTTSNFRDLVLHVHERPVTIPEIETFLADSGLSFRGFQLDPETFGRFQQRFPAEVWPGRLEHWAQFEDEHPRLFDGMYMLWCLKG
jgi:SAM-dependent methyltransferase/tetratricopeptide (TPR) repeat protein